MTSGHNLKATPSATDALAAATGDEHTEVIYLQGVSVLEALSARDLATLQQAFTEGTIIGMYKNETRLEEALGVVATGGTPVDECEVTFLSYGVEPSMRKELHVSLAKDIEFSEVLALLRPWRAEIEAAQVATASTALATTALQDGLILAADSGDPWTGICSTKTAGSIDGGNYEFEFVVYYLDTTDDYDWYRVDTTVLSDITDFAKTSSHDGWFTEKMTMEVAVTNISSTEAGLWDHMPTGTLNNTSESVTIRGSITTAQSGVSAEFSQSYSASDAEITDKTDPLTNVAQWSIALNGPSYSYYPWYTEPAAVARSSYEVEPALIVRVPNGQDLTMDVTGTVETRKDTLTFEVVELKVSESLDTSTFTSSIKCSSTKCTVGGSTCVN